jgi:hypothetical protein
LTTMDQWTMAQTTESGPPKTNCNAMMVFLFVLAFLLSSDFVIGTDAFTTTSSTSISWSQSLSSEVTSTSKADKHVQQVGSSRHSATRLQQLVHQKSDTESSNRKKEEDCHLPRASLDDSNHDHDDESRREALFSMFGALQAITGTSITIRVASKSLPANAASGDFAKIELPNPYQTLVDRATQPDANKFLYKGFDGTLLTQRLTTSTEALAKIPNLIEAKKWSQVTGVLLGPMGELLITMNQMVGMASKSEGSEEVLAATLRAKLNVVKKDLYAMQAAVDKRQADVALQYHAQSTIHLDEFIHAAL